MPGDTVSPLLATNLELLLQKIGRSSDVKCREIGQDDAEGASIRAVAVYIAGMTATEGTIKSLTIAGSAEPPPTDAAQLFEHYRARATAHGEVQEVRTFDELFVRLLSGNTIVFVDGCDAALSADTKAPKARPVEEPNVQSVVRGPREGFTEVLEWNTSLLRRKINDPSLWIEGRRVGRVTKTEIAIAYLHGIADPHIVEEVRRRIDTIDIDGVLESHYLEEFVQDKQITLFPTVFNSERPDVIAAGLLEGRVALLVDGTPFVLLVPALFVQFFQSSEDYYQRSDFSSLVRLLRFLSFLLATLTPSLYIAISTFHQEMLPTTLLYNLASQREGVPFPAFVEAAMMEITFEILREASVRMPSTIGQSISIVGTLVIGQAAVQAGLVSAAMVIVVSITAISNFVLPAFNLGIAARILRFGMMILGAAFGLIGIFIGLIVVIVHLCGLKSIGIPYMAPLAPFRRSDQKDALLRLPFSRMLKRPYSLYPRNIVRQKKRKT
ncbi:spore germination protein [Paenibacillus cymbidii]|uniref:spore germination protein n=1 Tax=Paenibacillus cymbidii TaxID=1639034 RepID=UPI001080305E